MKRRHKGHKSHHDKPWNKPDSDYKKQCNKQFKAKQRAKMNNKKYDDLDSKESHKHHAIWTCI